MAKSLLAVRLNMDHRRALPFTSPAVSLLSPPTPLRAATMNHTNPLSLADITTRLCLLLDDMIQEWDMELLDPINADTRLIEDLGFESVDLMQLIVAIEQAFGARGLPYEKALMQDGGYVTEISVGQLAQFLSDNLPKTAA
ncbi:MAG TPA: acyl carrier protein [Candidatus Competibacteraceae bacterium]|nr:MAG: acyl carrier protein [Candidatus Competibacteraceae bacterium]HNW78333.1 acyl carrier protein [Candidatus Competibacteraceae bacterium]